MINKKRLNEICNIYYKDIYRYCYVQLENKADAMDITQEVFLMLFKKSGELTDSNIKAWLYDVALIFIRRKRSADSKPQPLSLDSEEDTFIIEKYGRFADNDEIISLSVTEEEIALQKKNILSMLKDSEKKLYKAVYIDKKTSAQIAEDLKISTHAVEIRRSRLKQKIKKLCKDSFGIFVVFILNIFQ